MVHRNETDRSFSGKNMIPHPQAGDLFYYNNMYDYWFITWPIPPEGVPPNCTRKR